MLVDGQGAGRGGLYMYSPGLLGLYSLRVRKYMLVGQEAGRGGLYCTHLAC
jgi:hypothetical protein